MGETCDTKQDEIPSPYLISCLFKPLVKIVALYGISGGSGCIAASIYAVLRWKGSAAAIETLTTVYNVLLTVTLNPMTIMLQPFVRPLTIASSRASIDPHAQHIGSTPWQQDCY